MKTSTTSSEKLQKVLAARGLGSRREIERWIAEGRVIVNGKPAKIGDRVTGHEKIQVDHQVITLKETQKKTRVILYHKPIGLVCTRIDPEGRPTIFKDLPAIENGRWIMIGRLDLNSCGLILFTNNGELANRLMHPSGGFEREYAVRLLGSITPEIRRTLLKGIRLPDGMAKFKSIEDIGGKGVNQWYHVVLTEGRNREVRRMFESQGLMVNRLLRVRFGDIRLPRDLEPGNYIELSQHEIAGLQG
jgi:23S rRNA pseudouridine2605 synthase